MTKYSGSGWHRQSIRHSNARKYGKAGGKYSQAELQVITTRNKKSEQGLKILKGIMSKEDWNKGYQKEKFMEGIGEAVMVEAEREHKNPFGVARKYYDFYFKKQPAGWYDIGHTKHFGKARPKAPLNKVLSEQSHEL